MTEYLKHTADGMVPDEHGEYVRAESLSLARAQRDVAERRLERLKRRVADLFGDVSMELDEDGVAHVSGVGIPRQSEASPQVSDRSMCETCKRPAHLGRCADAGRTAWAPALGVPAALARWDGTCAAGHCPNPTGCEHDNRCRNAGVAPTQGGNDGR